MQKEKFHGITVSFSEVERSNYEHKTTADLKGMGAQTNVSALQPGDIIVHYTMSYDDWVAGGQQGAYNNHVIIYAGEFDNGDGSVVKRDVAFFSIICYCKIRLK